jgi:phytoene dehydrogenase-like protein
MQSEKRQVVIVGAGMAGLTAAAYLAREKFDVLLLDKNDRIGGLVGGFEKDGFFFLIPAHALLSILALLSRC